MKCSKFKQHRAKLVAALKVLCGSSWNDELLEDIPTKWEKHGDLILFSSDCFTSTKLLNLGEDLWDCVCQVLSCERVAKKSKIQPDGFRTPSVQLLKGSTGWVTKKENGILYSWDVTKCMFSCGNINEKQRVSHFSCTGQTVVDLFAGIGYFTLPYILHAGAALVYACEWNPDAVDALQKNLQLNKVSDKCIVLEGDCTVVCPVSVADRVNLGLIPSSEVGWKSACKALRSDVGGILHVHANVESHMKDSPDTKGLKKSEFEAVCWKRWADETAQRIQKLLLSLHNREWLVDVTHIQHVKSYAPHVNHVVADLQCHPLQQHLF